MYALIKYVYPTIVPIKLLLLDDLLLFLNICEIWTRTKQTMTMLPCECEFVMAVFRYYL